MRTLIVSTILVLSPVLAQAECGFHKEQAVMSCVDGMIYDTQAKACVKIVG